MPSRVQDDGRARARALGWFSLGLGAAQVAAPGPMSRLVGVADDRRNRIVMAGPCGVRELTAAAGLLGASERPAGWLWARVAGDALDLALLGAAFTTPGSRRGRVAVAAASVLGVAVADVLTALQSTRAAGRADEPAPAADTLREEDAMQAKAVMTIRRPIEEVYGFCRDLENLGRVFDHVESITTGGDGRSHWTMTGPAGTKFEWDAEIAEDIPNQVIAWRATDEGTNAAGAVRFAEAPGGRGTEVTIELDYETPGGKVVEALAKLVEGPLSEHVKADLRRLKQVLEVGEVVRSDGNPDGTKPLHKLQQRPAQPLP